MSDLLSPGFVFHQSNLQAFQICRYSFLLRYVRKLIWPAPLSSRTSNFEQDLASGSMLHSLICQYFLGIDPKMLVLCAKNFSDARVFTWFDNFLASPYARRRENQFPEHNMQITLGNSLLLAKFDLITIEDEIIQICDWKTSRFLPKRHFLQNRIQTKVYSVVAAKSRSQASQRVTMHYWEASYPDQPIVFEIPDFQLERYQDDLMNLISLIRSLNVEQFKRTEDQTRCACCEFQSYCARWGSESDEESLYHWLDLGYTDLQGISNEVPNAF